jgi:hypothetical protein
VDELVDDPWKVLPCEPGGTTCTVRFHDPEFAAGQRDALYYVRAIQQASPTVNGAQLRCEQDETGQCVKVDPCSVSGATAYEDDCLAAAQERAWSSPIFVDYGSIGP